MSVIAEAGALVQTRQFDIGNSGLTDSEHVHVSS